MGKTITKVIKVDNETKKLMNEFYKDMKRDKTPPYAIFQADTGDTIVTLYESGKVVFQGRDADLASDFWITTEKINSGKVDVKNNSNNPKKEKKKVDKKMYFATAIGSDEVGTGDYYGPIVVTACYINKENAKEIAELGVKDSKKLTDEQIIELVPKFIKKVSYHTYVMSAKKYNEIYDVNTMNMNKVKAVLHNKALLEETKKHNDYEYIIVDQFAKEYLYHRYLKDSPQVVNGITFITKGEDYSLAVACASLISRYTFLQEFDKVCKQINKPLPKGSGADADQIGAEIVKEYGFDKLKEIAKLNFRNTEKIKELI